MNVEFATCVRNTALEYIQRVYPSATITDTSDSAGPLLDFVEKDIVRIQDPMMYGNQIAVIPGKNWKEDKDMRAKILEASSILIKLKVDKENTQ